MNNVGFGFVILYFSMLIAPYLFAIIIGYLCGSIPFGLIFTRLFEKKDIRAIGSGNIGATNVLRTGNKKLALLTLACDALKGALPVLLMHRVDVIFLKIDNLRLTQTDLVEMYADSIPEMAAWAGIASVVGHIFPVWLKFQGGKGVATGLGVIAALSFPVALITIAIWLLVAVVFRYSSLGAIIAFLCCPLSAIYFTSHLNLCAFLLISILIVLKHRTNIIRLLTGTEPKIGKKPSNPSDS